MRNRILEALSTLSTASVKVWGNSAFAGGNHKASSRIRSVISRSNFNYYHFPEMRQESMFMSTIFFPKWGKTLIYCDKVLILYNQSSPIKPLYFINRTIPFQSITSPCYCFWTLVHALYEQNVKELWGCLAGMPKYFTKGAQASCTRWNISEAVYNWLIVSY